LAPILPAVPAFTGGERILPGQGNLASDVVAATGLGLLAGGLAYGAVTATGLGIIALGAAPLAVGGTIAGGILGVGAFLETLKQLQDWGLINWRPQPRTVLPGVGDQILIPSSINRTFTVNYTVTNNTGARRFCGGAPWVPASGPVEVPGSLSVFGVGIVFRGGTASSQATCDPAGGSDGTTISRLGIIKADGNVEDALTGVTGAVAVTTFFESDPSTSTVSGASIIWNGDTYDGAREERDEIPERVRPRLFAPSDLPDAPVLPAPPGSLPAIPQLPPPPDRRPLLPPAALPRPGQSPARVPSAPSPGRAPVPGGVVRPGTGTTGATVTASGVPAPRPPAVQTTAPGTTFLPGGRPLPANGPAPTMQAIATELGKLERKLEIILNPNDTLSPLELLNKVIDQTENIEFLINRLFPPEPYSFEAGSYQLTPICDRDSEGELLPPRVAPWSGGEGEFTELRQRLDALAELIQHHKDLKQPTCGGRGNGPGSNVTVHFESP
jgi:hypothetical protein